jgi:choline dehydrogenase
MVSRQEQWQEDEATKGKAALVGVVDEELRVHQVDKLRVADASVFPHIPSAPIASIVMAVGLAAGEMISRDAVSSSQSDLPAAAPL